MTTDPGRWDRRATFALAALVAIALASLPWLVHPWYEATDDTNDASIYIACARSMLAGKGYSYLEQPFTVRPPGWSLAIAAVLWLRGLDFRALNLLTSVFGVACVALVFVHARARIGTALAFLLALGVWFHDGFQRLCNQPMSDVPGVALLFACFALERWAAREPGLARDLVLAAAIGLSTYVRSVIVLLVPTILVARALERVRERDAAPRSSWLRFAATALAPLALGVVLVQLPWNVRNARHHPPAPVEQNYLFDYSTAMWHVDGGDPGSPRRPLSQLAGRIPERVPIVGSLVATGLRTRDSRIASVIGWIALASCAWIAWKRAAPAETFALLATGVLLVYFGFRDRLVLPVYLVVLVACADATRLAFARRGRERAATLALGAALLARPALDFRPHADWDDIARQHELYASNAAAIARAVGRDAVLAAPIGWHWSVYLDRPVWSTFFVTKRDGETAMFDLLRRRSVDTMILWPRVPSERVLVDAFERRFGPAELAGEARLYRVRR